MGNTVDALVRVCPVCGSTFTARLLASGKRQVTCSRTCMRKASVRVVDDPAGGNSLGWMDRAACLTSDPELWFESGVALTARTICVTCPVARECLNYALRCEGTESHHYRFGIYGVTGPEQRAEIARSRRAAL